MWNYVSKNCKVSNFKSSTMVQTFHWFMEARNLQFRIFGALEKFEKARFDPIDCVGGKCQVSFSDHMRKST